jgi:fructose-1,6-bisphosphatase/inositol monophosphatase family enzyme
MPDGAEALLQVLRELHDRIREDVVAACETSSMESLATVDREEGGDTQYAIDVVGERQLVQALTPFAEEHSLVLIAEGLGDGPLVLPRGADEATATWRVIIDPIDGTRGLMYQKRSAWVLSAAAPNRGPETSLSDLVLAVQTEIPLVKQHLSDQLWCVRNRGVTARRIDRIRGGERPLELRPSVAHDLEHGFATISRFFPGAKDELAAIEEDLIDQVHGPRTADKPVYFEDQYLSSGGQLYELMAGHDRFLADLRPLMAEFVQRRGRPPSLCSHPYDLCTALIAEELGVVVTAPGGHPLDAPLDVTADIAWIGYANENIRKLIEPALQACLRKRGLLVEEKA